MEQDRIDRMNVVWRQVRPDLDPSPLELVGRILVLAKHLEKSVEVALKKHKLSLGAFDILATLRRKGTKMTPGELIKSVILSSGAMTNRLDRLENAGLIKRQQDTKDRRGVVVTLTPKGKKLIDKATETRFQEAADVISVLNEMDRNDLICLLRKWLLQLEKKSSHE
jgi:DNA-binding MarR family transcriptional regulator